WETLHKEFPNYHKPQIRRIWREELTPELKRGPWTIDEDLTLRERFHNTPNRWAEIAKGIPGRNPAQCRTRWKLALDPNINFEPWTAEELDTLLEQIAINGRCWEVISRSIPGRSPQQCRQRAKMVSNRGLGALIVANSMGRYVHYGWSDSAEFERCFAGKSLDS
ncbi:hypothetical protein K493DRAFT_216543, partial [Basidiobolus meristosporus CBS 931.73]